MTLRNTTPERDIQSALRWEVVTYFNADHGVTIYTIYLNFGNHRARRDFYPIWGDTLGWEGDAFSTSLWMQIGLVRRALLRDIQ